MDNHHGGRAKHSTVTAITKIYDILYKNDEKSVISVILATDLSACYDTVDISILLQKLSHYGIRGEWIDLFNSYYTDRKQFVRLENAPSILRNSPQCSIIQGSKISGFMYNTYCNELPILHKLINTDIYKRLIDNETVQINNTDHQVISFIDDSTSVIGFKTHNHMRRYLNSYYKLLEGYYNSNKLKINSDKTKMIIINKPKLDRTLRNFYFTAGEHKITAGNKIKILGTWIQNNLRMDTEVGNLVSNLHNRVHNIRILTNVTDFKTRLQFTNSFIIGKLNYMLPIYSNLTYSNINKLHKLVMTAARSVIGSYCYKKKL